jgi:hypothetical protein
VRSYNRAHPSIGPLGEAEPLCPPNLVPLVVSDISQATQNNPENAARPDDIGAWDAMNAGLFLCVAVKSDAASYSTIAAQVDLASLGSMSQRLAEVADRA